MFGIEAEVIGSPEKAFVDAVSLVETPREGEHVDQPKGAQYEGALAASDAVIGLVAVDETVDGKVL